ncbi:MAG: pilus assembly protein PilP [Coxiellaceae bacterium]|nr:pilus assembly protein PilP [Coxiellaceae bacterium]
MRFLGLIRDTQTILGIVSDPMGGIYRVKVGDKIGVSQNRIVAIGERKIVTTNPVDNIYHASCNLNSL